MNDDINIISNKPGELTLSSLTPMKDRLLDVFEICIIVEKIDHLSADAGIQEYVLHKMVNQDASGRAGENILMQSICLPGRR